MGAVPLSSKSAQSQLGHRIAFATDQLKTGVPLWASHHGRKNIPAKTVLENSLLERRRSTCPFTLASSVCRNYVKLLTFRLKSI